MKGESKTEFWRVSRSATKFKLRIDRHWNAPTTLNERNGSSMSEVENT
jgi:hypothetical protein